MKNMRVGNLLGRNAYGEVLLKPTELEVSVRVFVCFNFPPRNFFVGIPFLYGNTFGSAYLYCSKVDFLPAFETLCCPLQHRSHCKLCDFARQIVRALNALAK